MQRQNIMLHIGACKSIFSRLKGKYIVNVGRSNCINEADLYDALSTKQLRGAAIDTWQIKPVGNEPLKPFAQPFDALDNIILASHKATFVASGHRRYVEDTLQNVLQYLNGNPPPATSSTPNSAIKFKKHR